MKKFMSKNWKKILITIGVICIVLNLAFKFIQKTNVVPGYIENGPVIERDIFDKISNPDIDINEEGLVDNLSETTGVSHPIAKLIVIGVIGLIIILILSAILDKDDKPAKKK